MADIALANQSSPTTPSAGNSVIFVDSSNNVLYWKDGTGRNNGSSANAAVAAQGAGFASDTYVTNSDVQIPSFSFQAKTTITWTIAASKTAAGVATPIYQLRVGAARTTGDTSRLSMTGPAQTAAIDNGILTIVATIRTAGASTVIQGAVNWSHDVAAGGFANNDAGAVVATGAAFDSTASAGQYIGLSINGGASAAWTLTQVVVTANW